jgi:anti-anti-sigma regulatory factor
MPIELVKDDAKWSVVLDGAVDIFDAAALHAVALEAAGAPGGVVARLGRAESVDTAVTQVLLGLKRALAASGHAFTLEEVPPAVLETWSAAGLEPELTS